MMKHDHSDTRLSCVECAEPVCPKCMVQCAVGNRCRKCAGKFESHMTKVTPVVIAKVVCSSLAAGYALTLVNSGARQLPFVGMLVVGFAAFFLGKLIHRVSGYKLGAKISAWIAIPLFIGLMFDPTISMPLWMSIMACNPTWFAHSAFLPALAVFAVLVPIFQDVQTR